MPAWESATFEALPGWYGAGPIRRPRARTSCTGTPRSSGPWPRASSGTPAGVPRLDPASLAFHREPGNPIPDAYALLDERFWCLPDDPEATHPLATVVPDVDALTATLRTQVRAHADAFLFPEPSALSSIVDGHDRECLARRRVSCCFFYRVSPQGPADREASCSTRPRTADQEHLRRYTAVP